MEEYEDAGRTTSKTGPNYQQGWAQGSFVEAEAEVEAERSRQRRGKAAMSLTEVNQGRGRELEAEARQTKFEARPRRGDPLKKTLLPLMYSNAKFGRFKSNCMTEGKWPLGPALFLG